MTKLAFATIAIALIAGAYLAVFYLAQRSLLFPVPPYSPNANLGRAEIVRLPVSGGEAQALFLAPLASFEGPAPLLIFMHGNAELADHWVPMFEEVTAWGMGALLLEYPGYGRSAGSPSERSINEAANAAYDWALSDSRIDSKRIVPYGRSLGGGPAVRLAVDRDAAALILESAFTSVADFAAQFLAPAFLVSDRFDSLKTLSSYRGPLLVVHGSHDQVVPIAHGRALAAAVAGAKFFEVPCGHNDCPRPWPLIRTFLDENGVTAPRAVR
ncbi:MAG: alpha/beta hydrolase [Acidobacteriota bacterium]|nr:alpha/beta hydrolase [Acidobacteriota bacterium]